MGSGDARRASTKLEKLERVVAGYRSAVVAFSGGADSALVVAVAARTLGERALAVTGASPALPPGELADAQAFCSEIGIRHRVVRTNEIADPLYVRNDPTRCFHCKRELYGTLRRIADREAIRVVASGTNQDDLDDVRPGLRAAAEYGVCHPLIEAGLTKSDVRLVSAVLGLRTAEKPASACLSSRIAYGMRITVDELTRVGRAERLLKDHGFRQCRVRVHGDLARIEVDREDLVRLANARLREEILLGLKQLGYRYVTVDLEGFRSGSMNP